MSMITLTTDWGLRDYHTAALKGAFFSTLPGVQLVDISHDVARHNIQQAAYIFRNALRFFPAGTLHFIGVHSQNAHPSDLIGIKKDGHIFIGINDGLFSMVFDEIPIDVVRVLPDQDSKALYCIPTIVRSASHLLNGKNLYELGQRPDEFVRRMGFQPTIEDELIRGVVIYYDSFGNIVTNISKELFERQRRGRKFEIIVRKSMHTLDHISDNYAAVDPGNAIAIFNEAGYLEIAINEGSAYDLMNLRLNDIIRIEFK